jgi:hypothetical protein
MIAALGRHSSDEFFSSALANSSLWRAGHDPAENLKTIAITDDPAATRLPRRQTSTAKHASPRFDRRSATNCLMRAEGFRTAGLFQYRDFAGW